MNPQVTSTSNEVPTQERFDIQSLLMSIMKAQESMSTTISGLKSDVDNLKVNSESPSKGGSEDSPSNTQSKCLPFKGGSKLTSTSKKPKGSTIDFQRAQSAPPASVISASRSPKPKLPSNNKRLVGKKDILPPSTPKRDPLQMKTSDFPPDFKGLKEAFYKYIKLLWNLPHQNAVPEPPSQETLVQFYQKFLNSTEIKTALEQRSTALMLDNNDIVQAFAAKQLQQVQLPCGLSKLEAAYESYIQGALVCLGFTIWSPNILQKSNELYNVACRISALTTLQQIAAAGAFESHNVNLTFIRQTSLLQKAYDHFAHYLMKDCYNKELKVKGSYMAGKVKGKSNKNRSRLRTARLDFAILQRFPKRYRKIIEEIGGHSDDEVHEKKPNVFVIKKLIYRSRKANIFFRKLDEAMVEYHENMGTASHMRTRVHPKVPIESKSPPPKRPPINFYSSKWVKKLSRVKQCAILDASNVAFLPIPEDLLASKPNPDERLSDKAFNNKFLQMVLSEYKIKEDTTVVEEADSGSESEGNSIDLEAASLGEDDESDGLFEPGEYHYDDDETEEEGVSESSSGKSDGGHSNDESSEVWFKEDNSMEGAEEDV
ncbi:hypothetical protein O181_069078 [Austropuccinia psidii MF-1]|uniref:Uncharacterized protein n=1 Tax=Austropuccinia psidii MF-1 TaxID=1389203 RepID=A0A9Q3F1K1_9BASI|nr:hypothetical protein [Austropuccinia psidii MF-1]